MINLRRQYLNIKGEIDKAIDSVLNSTQYIKGPIVTEFESNLANYLNIEHVISCANGTDALQIALMSLDLNEGDEVIVPSFTYVATAEVIALLNLKPVMVDVDISTFNIAVDSIKEAITENTKVIIPVHLFGQCCDMEQIMELAKSNNIWVIEDNAQAIGSVYQDSEGKKYNTGTIGDIGCTSFFPSKNLGCYGDGGAIFCKDSDLARRIRMITNHGQSKKYHHDIVGCNSRLDSIQAAILNVKLNYLDEYNEARSNAAEYYNEQLSDIKFLKNPTESTYSTHVYHQYTLQVLNGKRDQLIDYLTKCQFPSAIYYPIPLYQQKAYFKQGLQHKNSDYLCKSVLSIPIYPEITKKYQDEIILKLSKFEI